MLAILWFPKHFPVGGLDQLLLAHFQMRSLHTRKKYFLTPALMPD